MGSLYDRALLEVGNAGCFQYKFDLIYNVLFASLWSMGYYSMIYALTIIPHECKLPEKPDNISEYVWKSKYIPRLKTVAGTEKYSECLIYTSPGNNETKACDSFEYDKTWYETTVPSDNNWVCENEIYVPNILAYSRVGEAVGSLFFGWFGDAYGRKLTYVISLALLVTGRFVSVIASSSFIFFTLGCVVAFFPSWSAPQSAVITSMEISSPKRRATVETLRLTATSLGMCLMLFVFWWLRNWKIFIIITTAIQVPCLLFSWKLIESPQWLWISGKSKATVRCLKSIAKVNNTSLTSNTETEMLTTNPPKSSKSEVLGPLALFSGWRLSVNTILQSLLWVAVSANYTYVTMNSAAKSDGNPFLESAWQALAEIPGYFIAAYLANRIGRRYTGIISFSLTAIIWIIFGYREISNADWIKNEVLSTVLVVTNRCSITVSYYIIDLLNTEIYPTCLRQSGMSLGNLMSSGSSAMASYILYWGHQYDARYPSVILTTTTLLCGVYSTFFLPETLNVKLPETLEDARKFGNNVIIKNDAIKEM